MTDLSRRRLLAACGVGATGLAGCSALADIGGDDDEQSFDYDALRRTAADWPEPDPPDAFPVEVSDADLANHRDRAEALLEDVPASPSLPNGAAARELAAERERVADRLAEPVDRSGLDRLADWRRRRADAANVRAAYLAAVGEIDRETVEASRREVRSSLADFEVEWDYRAANPVDAVALHAALEDLVETCRRGLQSRHAFPERSQDAIFRVGDLVEGIESAAAAIGDARRLREQYLDGAAEATSHRATVTATAADLRYSVSTTQDRVSGYLDGDASSLDRDVEGTPAGHLFRSASWGASNRADTADEARGRHAYATSILEASRALAATEVLDDVITAIYDGEYANEPTASAVDAAHTVALDELRTAWQADPQSLAVPITEPGMQIVNGVKGRVEERYGGPNGLAADLAYAERYASVVPEATAFVVERLDEAAASA